MNEGRAHRAGRFCTTQWTLVLEAGDPGRTAGRAALETLCKAYWVPVYAYVRRTGRDADQAQDMTQAFFTHLLEKGIVGKADRERGRFRSFLLSSVKNYLANVWDREIAVKRGGKQIILSLDFQTAERSCRIDPPAEDTPETVFERHWAEALLRRALDRLQTEMERCDMGQRFQALRPFLTGAGDRRYKEVADELGMTESAVKVAVHRMRKRFGSHLRDEVSEGLADPADIDSEIHHLFAALEQT